MRKHYQIHQNKITREFRIVEAREYTGIDGFYLKHATWTLEQAQEWVRVSKECQGLK